MEHEVILELVEATRRRLSAALAWRWGGVAALIGAGVAAALSLARIVVPVALPFTLLAAAGLGAGVLTGMVLRALRRPTPLAAAQVLDFRFACADRFATAVEVITGSHRPTPLGPVLLADVARAAEAIDLRRGLRVRPGRTMWAAALLAVATVALDAALIGFTLPGTPARQVAQTIRQEGRRLERASETMEEQARLDRARQSRRVAPSVRSLGQGLQRERLERAEALARLERLGREIEAARRAAQERATQAAGEPRRKDPNLPADLFRRRSAADRTLRQIREIAERLAQSRSPQERDALMRQLDALAGGGEDGNVPTRAREQADTARRQLAAGDTAGARRTLQQSATDLDDLRAMLADEEGLQQAQRDLQRSAESIARGRSESAAEAEQNPQAVAPPGSVAPGPRALPQGEGNEAAEPPPGPNEGSTAGQGAAAEKLGDRTPRLEADRQQSRVRGLQSEGRVTTGDLLGPGRPAAARRALPRQQALAAARADADRYMARHRIPPEYREIVRRYFESLAVQR
ncbi:MAG: hypothetical protein ACT4PY_15390 [Armatimonadota bacterium]